MKFFTMSQVPPSVFSFSDHLELFSAFEHIYVGPNDVSMLVVSHVRLLRNSCISLSYL